MLTAEQRYRQAMQKTRMQFARGARLFMEDKIEIHEMPCRADLERAAIIAEIERASLLGCRSATVHSDQRTSSDRKAD